MASNFGRLLRGHRLAANLTQEALAEAARVSTAAIGAYERGIHAAPHRETVALLADALQLNGPARNEFEVAARRKRRPREAEPPADVSRVDNIPVPLTSFFGREADTAQIEEMLRRNRLVTLTGTGGIGKTRLALHVAARLKTTYRDGASFIDFASASDEKLVGSSFASALGISVPSHTDSAMLSTLIGRQSKLLIFDNCEHLLDGVGVLVSAVLNAAPNVTVLATSRERLRLSGEAVYRLSTLPIPANESVADAEDFPGVELFLDRAAQGGVVSMGTQARTDLVVEICKRLEGIPLALELAAARVSTVGLVLLHQQLAERLTVLGTGNRDVPSRQRTLDATLRWSFDLLTKREQLLFCRLGVFISSWTLQAAVDVCSDDLLGPDDILDSLAALVDKSMVTVVADSEPMRYRLLHVMRMFAIQRAMDAGETNETRRRHALWVMKLAEARLEHDRPDRWAKSARLSASAARPAWRAENRDSIGDVRAAIDWALGQSGDAAVAATIIVGFDAAWRYNALHEEHRRFVKAAIAAIDANKHPRLAANLCIAVARVGLGTERVTAAKRALKFFEGLNDEPWTARTLVHVAQALLDNGEVESALPMLDRADRLFRKHKLGLSIRFVELLFIRGQCFNHQGHYIEARKDMQEALEISRALDHDYLTLGAQVNLAEIEFVGGYPGAAMEIAKGTLEQARALGVADIEVYVISNRIDYRFALGDIDGARDDVLLMLSKGVNGPIPLAIPKTIRQLARIAAATQRLGAAARLAGYVEAYYSRDGIELNPTERLVHARLRAELSNSLSSDNLDQMLAEGATFTPADAMREALLAAEAPELA